MYQNNLFVNSVFGHQRNYCKRVYQHNIVSQNSHALVTTKQYFFWSSGKPNTGTYKPNTPYENVSYKYYNNVNASKENIKPIIGSIVSGVVTVMFSYYVFGLFIFFCVYYFIKTQIYGSLDAVFWFF